MYDQTIPRRIRARREQLQLAGYQLAKMAGISPSYLSLIESGRKLPSEEVAERLAQALGDDPELYRAWVETGDDADLAAKVQRLEKIQRVRSDPGPMLHRRGRSPMRARGELFDEMQVAAESMSPRRSISQLPLLEAGDTDGFCEPYDDRVHTVPLLDEGADPVRFAQEKLAEAETITIDFSLAPDNNALLFAYRVTERGIERVRNLVRPADILILAADPEGVDPAAIYAVRVGGRIVLSRIVYTPPTLLLTASDPYQDPLALDVGDEDGLLRSLAGVVVTGVRSWPMPARIQRRGARPAPGRSGKIEGGNIVRDCEWKENYGWRPVQKAEDLDYLDAHPGAKVQFRLLRDGEIKYVLEMDPEQWRQALASHYEGSGWRRNGYIVAITRRVSGEYTEEFQDRWAPYLRRPES